MVPQEYLIDSYLELPSESVGHFFLFLSKMKMAQVFDNKNDTVSN